MVLFNCSFRFSTQTWERFQSSHPSYLLTTMSNFNIPRLFKAFRSSRSFSSLVRVLLSSVVCCFQILYNVKKKMNSFPKLCMKRRMWRETADGSSSSLTSVLFYFPSITRLSVRPGCPSDPAVFGGNRAKMPASGLWSCWTSREVSGREFSSQHTSINNQTIQHSCLI